MAKTREDTPKAPPYRDDNRPVGTPTWREELDSWLDAVEERPRSLVEWEARVAQQRQVH